MSEYYRDDITTYEAGLLRSLPADIQGFPQQFVHDMRANGFAELESTTLVLTPRGEAAIAAHQSSVDECRGCALEQQALMGDDGGM